MKKNIVDFLSEEVVGDIKKYIIKGVSEIQRNYEKEEHDLDELIHYLYFLNEVSKIENSWLEKQGNKEIVENILQQIRNRMYQGEKLNFSGLLNGVLLFHIVLKDIDRNARYNFENFLKYLEDVSKEYIMKYINVIKNEKLKFSYYDLVLGVSGFLQYLDIVESNDIELREVCYEYLIKLCNNKSYENKSVINFHIEKENQYLESERREQPNGHINFGVAHGMIAPAFVLSKCGRNTEAVSKILSLYEKFRKNEDISYYPMQLSFEDYITENFECGKISSWCYGNLGIERTLMLTYKNLEDNEKYKFSYNRLKRIINQSIENYNLFYPIVCHGYARVIAIQIAAYLETNDEEFLLTLERNIRRLFENERQNYFNKDEYENDIILLTGRSGVILTLLSIFQNELSFSKLLLLQ